MTDILLNRRTIRNYSNEPIAPAIMENLLLAAMQASNTGNMQAYSVIITTDFQLKQQLSPAHFNQPMVKQAPAILTFCADFNRISAWCEQSKAVPGFANFQSFMAAAIDAIIVAQTFAVAAETQGLGICYLGTTTYNAQEIINILNIPRLVVPITTLTVGYPADNPPLTDRLPLEAVIHHQVYTNYRKEDIQRMYADKEKLEIYRKFTEENNKETLAQVFTDVRYTKKNNEFFSDKFITALRNQGFLSE